MDKIYCTHCGAPNHAGDHFCVNCGAPLTNTAGHPHQQQAKAKRSIMDNATRTINNWTGEDKSVKINLHDFFAQVWQRHTEAEAENIFIAGTPSTTPSLAEVSSQPVQPWLYTRIFMGLLLATGILLAVNVLTGLTLSSLLAVFLSMAIPVSLVIFFLEINVFKNISFYVTTKIFLIGGLMSLLVTLFIYMIVGTNPSFDVLGSTLIGFIEETGKLLVGCYFVSKLRLTHVFNGMLVGGAVGAGFAAIENIKYANDLHSNFIVPVLRTFYSLGTHSIWCAITVAAIVLVNGNRKLTFDHVANLGFFRFFLCAVTLHALWDWQLPLGTIKYVILICVGWLVLFVLIHTGLREVKFIQNQLQNNGESSR